MKEITVKTRSRCEIVDITQQINAALPAHIAEGIAVIALAVCERGGEDTQGQKG